MTEASPEKPSKPIAEFVVRPDFPECTLGEFVDIGGYTGEVVNVVHNSIKVRSPEGVTRGFNFHTLRKLYGPPPEEPPPLTAAPEVAEKPADSVSSASRTTEIENPNFDQEIKSIGQLAGRPDFPECALGQFVDIRGYAGVVVQVVDHSLIVRAQEGTSRRYNADILRKLHGK